MDMAELTCGDVPAFATVRARNKEDVGLRVPYVVRSYVNGAALSVPV